MDLSNFSKSEQKKAILFWYETNAKGKKYGKKLTWDEFGGKCYLQNKRVYEGNWKAETRTQLENKIRRTVKNIKESEPEIFRNLFLNLKEKIAHANKYGLETLTN